MKYFVYILVAAFLTVTGDSFSQSVFHADETSNSTLNDKKLKDLIEFYPNPSKGSFKLNIKDEGVDEFNLTIYDLNGSMVFEKTFTGLFAGISFDLKLKKPGLYLVKINTGKDQFVEKILINP